jgi:hypothetical protein
MLASEFGEANNKGRRFLSPNFVLRTMVRMKVETGKK